MYYILDWKEIIKKIFEKKLAWMRAGLNGDWDNTVGTILKNGEPVLKNKIESTFFFYSTWAIPAIEFYDEEKGKIVRENCFYESEIPPEFDPELPWPEPYLEDYWIRKFETFAEETDVKDDCAPPKPKNSQEKKEKHFEKISREESLSFKNSLKTIETHITALKTEFQRLLRLVPKEELSQKGIEKIISTMMPLTEYILSIYDSFAENGQIKSIDPTDEEFLEKVFKEAPQMMKKVLEKMEEENKTFEDEDRIFQFTERATDFLLNFRNLLETYLEWKLILTLEINPEELKDIVGKGKFN